MNSFVILHYKNLDDTLECINCIKKIKGKKSIIVVDNNSCSKEDADILKKEHIDLKLLDKNYGFAKANNIGIKYAQEKYNPDFVIVINNDVFITQVDFLKTINKLFEDYNFDMLGPCIESTSGESINPFPALKNLEEVKKAIIKSKILIRIYRNKFLYILLKFYMKIKSIIFKRELPKNSKKLEFKVPLHGCAIIFSNNYLNKYLNAFYNETFLFHEEEFLYQRVLKDNLISIYSPKIKVFHKEGASVKKSSGHEIESKLFCEKEKLKSLVLLERELYLIKGGKNGSKN